ncbi:hypothetical protein MCOR14_011783 [Pyricularia oryzae]|nr:hypothetical protein MCOR34_011924 [Pyricularia oryzae]KAI6519938.1 hypothetical protein MCOR05_010963 [Pyricularia oryzae]KAI6611910.1 hypothetical protein MCOR14_011783 [Pyricularia oryzae]
MRSPVAKATFLDDKDVLPETELAGISLGPENTFGAISVHKQKSDKPSII